MKHLIILLFPIFMFAETVEINELTLDIPSVLNPTIESLTNNTPTEDTNIIEEIVTNDTDLLFQAIFENNIEAVDELLKKVDVNSRDELSRTPLMRVTDISLDIAKLLLDNKAYLNTRDDDGNTALIYASKNHQVEMVSLLLAQPNVIVNLTNNQGYSALQYAIENGNVQIVTQLLDKNANFAESHPNNLPAIIYSTQKGYTGIVDALLKRGIDVNTKTKQTDTSLLSIAVAYEHLSTVRMLLNHNAAVNNTNNLGVSPLFIAVGKKNYPLVELLMDNGADPTIVTSNGLTLNDIIASDDKKMHKLLNKRSKK